MTKQIFKSTGLKLTTLSAMLVLLTACGGGGGGGGSSSGSASSTNEADTNTVSQVESQPQQEENVETQPEVAEETVVAEEEIAPEPEVTEPEIVEPEVVEPEVVEPEITEPAIAEPEVDVPQETFMPDEQLLESIAADSNELYVDPEFTFEAASALSVYFTVTDVNGNLSPRTLIKMYSVPASATNWDDIAEADKQLVLTGVTDANGVLDIAIDLAEGIDQVLAIANVLGIENKALLPVESQTISHNFQ